MKKGFDKKSYSQSIKNNIKISDEIFDNKVKKISKYLIIILCVALVLTGFIMGTLLNTGHSYKENDYPILISKQYFVQYNEYDKAGTNSASAGQGLGLQELRGKITLESTSLSVQKSLKVQVDLHPKNLNDPYISNMMRVLPNELWVIFPNAVKVGETLTNNDDNEITIINLTKSIDPPKYSVNGTIKYLISGTQNIYLIDYTELPKISKIHMGLLPC